MKVTFYPPKSEVIATIQAKIDRETASLAENEADLAKVKESKIIRPGQDTALEHLMAQRKEFIARLEARVKLLQAAVENNIQVEMEV